jgi:hypothetical protein
MQATVEEVERREREAALQNPDSHDLEADEEGQAEYSEEQQFEQVRRAGKCSLSDAS